MAVSPAQLSPEEALSIERDFSRQEERPLQRAYCRSCSVENGSLVVLFLLATNRPIRNVASALFKFRDEGVRFPGTLQARALGWSGVWSKLKAGQNGLRLYQIECNFHVPWTELPTSIYGIEVVTELGTSAVRTSRNAILFPTPDETLYSYRDPSGRMLRFELYHLPRSSIEGLRRRRPHAGARIECLIGEYTNSARDNGIALFRALRGHPGISARYVVEADNPDGLHPNGDDILAFGSLEHLRACLNADVVAFSHHASYVLPGIVRHLRASQFRRVKRFFLQHGITALKASMKSYHKKVTRYDAFNVCSELEQKIIMRTNGFERQDVVIAGLPRHDELLRLSRTATVEPSRILVFPTWRKGLEKIESEGARATPFVRQWIAALEALHGQGAKVTFILHPVIRRHAHLFAPFADAVAEAVDFQRALVECSALVTDYSSVCFEALYLDKPVFFFTFDATEFGFAEHAYIDVDTQLPGLRLTTPRELAAAVIAARDAGWSVPPGGADRFFAYRDERNSERCAQVILDLGKRARS